jgi:hypothetical protein
MNTKSDADVKSQFLEARAPEFDFIMNAMTGDFSSSAIEQRKESRKKQ